MPLALGLVPDSEKQAVLSNLIADIRAHNDHFTAGDLGHHYVIKALMDNLRFRCHLRHVATQSSQVTAISQQPAPRPCLRHGMQVPIARRINTCWVALRPWLYRGLAGLDVDMSPDAADPFILEPAFVDGLSWMNAILSFRVGNSFDRMASQRQLNPVRHHSSPECVRFLTAPPGGSFTSYRESSGSLTRSQGFPAFAKRITS